MKIHLDGLISNASSDLKARTNLVSVRMVIEGLRDVIVALGRGDTTIEEIKDFLCIDKCDEKYFNSLVIIKEEPTSEESKND